MFAPDGNAMSIQLTMRMVVPYNICDGATRAECGMKRKFPETLTSQYEICGSGELKKKQISQRPWSMVSGALHLNGRRLPRTLRPSTKKASRFPLKMGAKYQGRITSARGTSDLDVC